jgi:hypothetical protein
MPLEKAAKVRNSRPAGGHIGDVHHVYFKDYNPNTVDFIRDAYRKDLSIKGGCLTREWTKLCDGPDPSFLKPARRHMFPARDF